MNRKVLVTKITIQTHQRKANTQAQLCSFPLPNYYRKHNTEWAKKANGILQLSKSIIILYYYLWIK